MGLVRRYVPLGTIKRFYRPWPTKAFEAGGIDISFLHHFPTLRTWLLSLYPSGACRALLMAKRSDITAATCPTKREGTFEAAEIELAKSEAVTQESPGRSPRNVNK